MLPRVAAADVLITPFVGKSFAAQTTLPVVETGVESRKWVIGASATWLSSGVLGVEGDFSYLPGFFDAGQFLNTPGSNVTSFTGSLVLAAPLGLTRESLRPYLTLGMGVLHAGVDDLVGFSPVDRNLAAVSVGGGAIGFLTDRTGLRFDIRRVRSVRNDEASAVPGGDTVRLGFWRATVGVTLRY